MPQLAPAKAWRIAAPQNCEWDRGEASSRAVADEAWRTTARELTVADAFVRDEAVRTAAPWNF